MLTAWSGFPNFITLAKMLLVCFALNVLNQLQRESQSFSILHLQQVYVVCIKTYFLKDVVNSPCQFFA